MKREGPATESAVRRNPIVGDREDRDGRKECGARPLLDGDISMAVTPEARELALKLLQQKGHFALDEVERLLGWDRPVGMLNAVMARHLGVTEGQLKYLIHGKYLREKERAERQAAREAKALTLVPHMSETLGFSISLPPGWAVTTDTTEIATAAAEYSELIQRSQPDKVPRSRVFLSRRANIRGAQNVVDLADRLQAKREHEERKAEAERHARLERMTIGLFQAAPPNDEDEALVEITRLRLDSRLTAKGLYSLDKHLPEAVPWGNRPSKGMLVDGLQGVIYYFVMHTGMPGPLSETYTKEPAFFNVYLSEDLEGWLISCQCRCGEAYMKTFHRYKPIYRRVIGTFRRARSQ
jgi:hypothetical protein